MCLEKCTLIYVLNRVLNM